MDPELRSTELLVDGVGVLLWSQPPVMAHNSTSLLLQLFLVQTEVAGFLPM